MIKKFTRISALVAGFFLMQNNIFANANKQNVVTYCSPTISNNQIYLNWVHFGYNSADVTGGVSHFNTGNTGYNTSAVGTTSGTIKRGCGAQLWLSTMTTLNSAVGFKVTVYGDWNNDGDFTDANELSNSYSNTIPAGSGAYMNYPVTVYVPYNANQGNVRLRFIVSESNATVTPCGSVNGEVEDYLITIANNAAPVLNTSAMPVLNNIITAQTNTSGIKVKSLIESSKPTATLITDADGCPKYGVAVTGTTGTGTWQYLKTTGTWTNISGVSTSNALLLQDSSSIRYVPSGVETATITVKAWDQTSGTDGSFANVSSGGTTTAYSINSKTINQVVVAGASYTSSMNLLSYGGPNKIVSASFDRTNKLLIEPTVLNTDANFGYGTDLELDEANNKIYWSGTGSTGNDIYTANADGTNPTVAITNGYAMGLAIGNGKAYLLQYDGLFSANLNGTGITAISGGANQLSNADITDVKDIDFYNNKLYFAYQSTTDYDWHIMECNTDGTGLVDKYSIGSGRIINNLDVTGGSLFWAENDGTDSYIYKRTISGISAGTLVGTLNGTTIFSLKADDANTTIYASTYESNGTSKIYKISYAGSSFTKLLDLDFPVAGIAFPSTVVATPAITSSSSFSTFTSCSGTVSGEQSFTVSGTDLTANLVVTAPAGYEVSLTSGSGFASSVNAVPTSGAVSNKTVYVRLTTNATGNQSGNIVLSSTDATDKTIALTGNVTNTPDVPELTSTPICGAGTVTFTSVTPPTRLNIPVSPNKLYNAASAGAVVGSDFTTPTISQTTDFWATQTVGSCESARVKVTATVNQPSTATIYKTACDSYNFGGNTLTESGEYKDTIPNMAGCDSVIVMNLNIMYIPSTPFVMQPNAVCDSGTFMLSALPKDNTRKHCRECSDENVYLWKNAEGDSVFNDADFQTPLLRDFTYYTVTAANECGISDPYTVDISINHVELPELISDTICSGNSAELNANYSFNTRMANARKKGLWVEYIWYTANGDSITQSETYETNELTETTLYMVKAKLDGCYSDFESVVAYVKNKPSIVNEIENFTACNGTIAKFKVVATGDSLTYAWGAKFENVWDVEKGENKDSVEFNVDGSGNGLEIFTIVSNSCGKDTSLATLTVNVVDTKVLVSNGTISANLTNVSYQWVNMDTKTIIEEATDQTYTPKVTGNYAVVLNQMFVNMSNCTDTSDTRYVEVIVTSVEPTSVTNFSIFPNPATDKVTITLSESVLGTVSIVDLQGNVVATKLIEGNNSNISTAELASGVYVVKISSDKGVAVNQLIVQ